MKKVLSVLLSLLLMFGICSNAILAFEEKDLKTSYDKVLEYYKTTSIMYLDEIIVLGNAGVDVSKMPLNEEYCEYDLTQDFNQLNAGMLGKFIIASIFMKEEPTDINGYDLVELLRARIDENGEIEECINDADDFVWPLFAMLVMEDEIVYKMADVLVSYQITENTSNNRDNDKGGFYGAWGVSMDVVGLCIEALTLVDREKYQDAIALSLAYLERKQGIDAGYDPNDIWGDTPANSDTQACVVEGLLVYDKKGVLSTVYDKDENSIFDVLLKYQNVDGSFINGGWDAGTVVANPISTFTVTRSLSTYFEGSFVENAKEIYKDDFHYIYFLLASIGIVVSLFTLTKRKE